MLFDYHLITAMSPETLDIEVKAHGKFGWDLHGDWKIDNRGYYCQAMKKERRTTTSLMEAIEQESSHARE